MNDLYKRIETLCSRKGVTVTQMCREAGVSRGSITDLKCGRSETLSMKTISKLSEYFEIPSDYFTNEKGKEMLLEIEYNISDTDLKFALFGDENVDDESLEEVKKYAEFVRQMRNNKN